MRLLIAGGGTGGHLFPGVALADELRERSSGHEVLFVGTKQGIEARVLPKLGWKLSTIQVSGLKTKGIKGKLLGLCRLPRALWQSRRVLREYRPDVVLGVGGYASGPVVLAAWLMGIPTGILEQNSIPGFTNRVLGKLARAVFTSFDSCDTYFSAKRLNPVGNPIRPALLRGLTQKVEDENGLLIVGGSQGAVAVNRLVVQALTILKANGAPLPRITHQTGKNGFQETGNAYSDAGIDAHVTPFIDDMAKAYREATVVVARAGATTVAELTIVGRPAIFIPYPFAADNHQEENARELVNSGAAQMFNQDTSSSEELATSLQRLFVDAELRQSMSAKMKTLGRPNAAENILNWCFAQVEK